MPRGIALRCGMSWGIRLTCVRGTPHASICNLTLKKDNIFNACPSLFSFALFYCFMLHSCVPPSSTNTHLTIICPITAIGLPSHCSGHCLVSPATLFTYQPPILKLSLPAALFACRRFAPSLLKPMQILSSFYCCSGCSPPCSLSPSVCPADVQVAALLARPIHCLAPLPCITDTLFTRRLPILKLKPPCSLSLSLPKVVLYQVYLC